MEPNQKNYIICVMQKDELDEYTEYLQSSNSIEIKNNLVQTDSNVN